MSVHEEDETGPITWTGEERRRIIEMTEGEWRSLIIDYLIRQHRMLMKIDKAMEYFTFGKILVRIVAWTALVAAGVGAILNGIHDRIR